MTAVEAIIYCLGFINETPEDGEYHSQICYDKNGQPHWISWSVKLGDDASPWLCSESSEGKFTKSLEPYST